MKTRTNLSRTFITTEKVRRKIHQLKPHSAAGPDGISPKLLQQCEDQLAPVLAMIFRKSVNTSKVPEEWKTAAVVPIYKKGAKSVAGNYRPVSLTCVSCKLLESILKDDIMEHLVLYHKLAGVPGKNHRGSGQGNSHGRGIPGFR